MPLTLAQDPVLGMYGIGKADAQIIPYHPPVHQRETAPVQDPAYLRNERANEGAKRRLLDSNGRVLDFSSKADLYDNDRLETQKDMSDFVQQQAEYLTNKKNVNTDPDAYKETMTGQQRIIDKVSRAQQQKKKGDDFEKRINLDPGAWQPDAMEVLNKWKETPSDKRGSYPPIYKLGRVDIFSAFDKYKPGVEAYSTQTPGPDGITKTESWKGVNPKKLESTTDQIMTMTDTKEMWRAKRWAMEQLEADPTFSQLPPDKQASAINTLVRKSIKQHFIDISPTAEAMGIKKTPDGSSGSSLNIQMGLGDAEKSGIVKRDVNINAMYQPSSANSKGETIPAVVRDMKVPYYQSLPANAKLKSAIAASVEMRNLQTGKAITDPGESVFVPGAIVVKIRDGKAEKMVLGYTVDKANYASMMQVNAGVDPTVKPQAAVQNDVEVPLSALESNFKAAGIQYKWTDEALKDVEGRLATYLKQQLNSSTTDKAKSTSPEKTTQPSKNNTVKKRPIGNLN